MTDTDWLYILTTPEGTHNGLRMSRPSWAVIREVLTSERLGRIQKPVLAQIMAKCPDKETRLHIIKTAARIDIARQPKIITEGQARYSILSNF